MTILKTMFQVIYFAENCTIAFENSPNKTLHLTAIPLRSITAGELGRYADTRIDRNGIWPNHTDD